MSRRFDLECLAVRLSESVAYAARAGLGEHFVSELNHLAATVAHNLEEEEKSDTSRI